VEHRIGEILMEMKACTSQDLHTALKAQSIFGGRLGTNLLELGIVDARQLAAALSRAHGVPCLAEDVEPEPRALAAIPPAVATKFAAVPLHLDGRCLRIVMADPRDVRSLDDLAFATGLKIEPLVAPEARIFALIRKHFPLEKGGPAGAGEDHAAGGLAKDDSGRVVTHEEALRLIDLMSDPVVLSALLVRGAAHSVGRAVFLKMRGDRALAWLGAGKLLGSDIRGAAVVHGRGTLFGAAVDLRAPVLAPVEPSPLTQSFYEALGGPLPMNAYVGPLILRGRAVAVIYADLGPGGTLRNEATKLLELTGAINRRFETLALDGA
jgi:hypothetical protein